MKVKVGISVTILALFLLGIGYDFDGQTRPSYSSPVADPQRSVRIELDGLTTDRVERVRQALSADPGVQAIEFDVDKKEARVKFDLNKTDLSKLAVDLRKAGFTPWFH